jgi:hypothetical protein
MRKTIGTVAVTLIVAASPLLAQAGQRDPGGNARQANQQARIGQGVRSGELTKHETHRLEREQRGIAREERRYKADGQLTARERADLHHDLNAASRDIYRQKHDGQER